MRSLNCVIGAVIVSGAFAEPVRAQTEPRTTTEETRWSAQRIIQLGFGYPDVYSVGLSVVMGRERIIPVTARLDACEITGMRARGLLLGVDAGFGGISARAGWARLASNQCDEFPPVSRGFSIEAIARRPWILEWRGRQAEPLYAGVGASFHFNDSPLAISGALLRSTNSTRQWLPMISVKMGVFW